MFLTGDSLTLSLLQDSALGATPGPGVQESPSLRSCSSGCGGGTLFLPLRPGGAAMECAGEESALGTDHA